MNTQFAATTHQKHVIFNTIKQGLMVLLLMVATWQCYQLTLQIKQMKAYQNDLAEISHIRYGLLNADEWVKIISRIVAKKIDEFELTDENRQDIQQSVERLMDQLIVELDAILRNRNSDCNSVMDCLAGGTKQIMTDVLIDINSLREHVPEFTEIALDELNTPAARNRIKYHLLQQLQTYANRTFTHVDMRRYAALMQQHHCLQKTACTAELNAKITALHQHIGNKAISVIAVVIIIFILAICLKPFKGLELSLLILSCLLLLLISIGTPMIEVEAKIDSLTFQLLNEPVLFQNQLLYFQNKSILDIVSVLMQTQQAEMIAVAALIFLFSILFPLTKLICSLLYYYDTRKLRGNSLVTFFALKSGKWSMADVMVVAFFMAYLGFDGMISSQLSSLTHAAKQVDVLTTNGTSLQVGFFLFLAFCLAGLMLSAMVEDERYCCNDKTN